MSGVLNEVRRNSKFESFMDAEQFMAEIAQLIAAGSVEEVLVAQPLHPMLKEYWYRDVGTGEIWRYCPPEFPMLGRWEKVR